MLTIDVENAMKIPVCIDHLSK